MLSKWYDKKAIAIKLRKKGISIVKIGMKLGIPRSTLSDWFKDVELTRKQKLKLEKRRMEGLIKARKKAVIWHNLQKEKRLKKAREEAIKTLKQININDKRIIDLALAILYLGEGSKKNLETSLSSSDPLILNFFLTALKNIYNINIKNIRCELYLRADQDPVAIKNFWSGELKLSSDNFKYINLDKRTKGSKTYHNYKGVCNLRCSNVAIRRKLMYLSEEFIKSVIKNSVK